MKRHCAAGHSRTRLEPRPIWPRAAIAILVALIGLGQSVAIGQEAAPEEAALDPPEICSFPSTVGEVTFPHQMHFDDFEMACVDCHHEVNAAVLHSPHPEYFADFWIKCGDCHREGEPPMAAKDCDHCHQRTYEIDDQTLSAKVAVHTVCSECHEIGTGAAASATCSTCHSGPKKPW